MPVGFSLSFFRSLARRFIHALGLLWALVKAVLRLLRGTLKATFIIGVAGVFSSTFILFFIYVYYWEALPRDLSAVEDYQPRSLTQVFSEDGALIGEFYLERRVVVPLRKISPTVINAFLAAEDARFFQHRGIDPKGIARAFLSNIQAGRVVQGGSTITQQVVKNLLLSSERSFERKLKEAILSFRIERELTKRQILGTYLNMVYLGHGAYGVEAAARSYFGRSADQLTLAEAAMLAGLVKAPSANSPYLNFEGAKERQGYVLNRMVKAGFTSRSDARKALDEPLTILSRQDANNQAAPYFVEHVRRLVMARYGGNLLYRKGLRIETTLRMDMQTYAREAVRRGLEALTERKGYHGPDGVLHPAHWDTWRSKSWKDVLDTRRLEGKRLEPVPMTGDIYNGVVLTNEGHDITIGIGPYQAELVRRDLSLRAPRFANDTWLHETVGAVLKPGSIVRVKYLAPATDSSPAQVTVKGVPVVQGALIAIESHTGYVRAMVGGYDFKQSRFNRAIQSRRQPGSSFKPIIYATALEGGLTQMTVLTDAPTGFRIAGGSIWTPRNYGGRYYGKVTLRTALTKSLNSISVKLLNQFGVDAAIRTARSLGIRSPLAANLSLALGSSGVSLMELATAYATIANLGKPVEPIIIKRIIDGEGRIIEDRQAEIEMRRAFLAAEAAANGGLPGVTPEASRRASDPDSTQVISPASTYVLIDMMTNVVQHGTGRRVRALGRPVAGKTGTTNGYKDAWFMGFTPNLVAGVWVGTDTGNPLGYGETGGTTAAPIWLDFMEDALKDEPIREFDLPADVVFAKADPIKGEPSDKVWARYYPFRLDNLPPRFLTRVTEGDPADEL